MFTLTVLGSGSAGNCALIESTKCRLLIDAGMSARQIIERLQQRGLKLEDIDGILLTHEHGDHAGGIEVLCKQYSDLAIYCTSTTGEALRYNNSRKKTLNSHKNWCYFRAGNQFTINDCEIESFVVPHDAVEPVGFIIQNSHDRGEGTLGFLTDLGHVTPAVLKKMQQVDTLFIEANHDSSMLVADTKRPWSTKQRIMSRHGHLSNQGAAEVVSHILQHGEGKLVRSIFGHLSRDCNSPKLVFETMQKELQKLTSHPKDLENVQLYCASQAEISDQFQLCKLKASLVLSSLPENYQTIQLDLF